MKKNSSNWVEIVCFLWVLACIEMACNMRDSQFAHLPPSDYFYKRYEGKIGEKSDFVMQLNRLDSIVEGSYYYNKVGTPILLNGKIAENGRILLVESIDGQETGRFEGKFKSGNQEEIEGEWIAKGKKMPFEMQESYEPEMAQLKLENCAKSYGKCDFNSGIQKGCAKIRLNYLQIIENTSKTVQEKVNEKLKFMAFENKNPENITTDFIAQYQKDLQELSPEFTLIYEKNLDMKALLNEKNLLTIQCTNYEYMGGAHGSMNHAFLNFDLRTGEEIIFSSLFSPDMDKNIEEIAELEFRLKNNISENKTFEEAGYWFENNEFYLPKKFYLLKDKIVFQYEEYEIAPYSMGVQIIEIPYKQLEKIILKESVLASFLKL